MKANTLVYLIDEVSLNRFLATSGFMLEKMSKNFKEIFILNFVDYKKKFNFFIDLNKEVKAEKKEVSPFKLPKNIKLINIKSDKDFTKFCIYRNVIGIDLLGRRLVDLPIHLLLAKNDVKLIQISNIGNIQFTLKIDNILIGFIKSFTQMKTELIFVLTISILYVFFVMGLLGTPRYFTPALIFMSPFFGNFFLKKNN